MIVCEYAILTVATVEPIDSAKRLCNERSVNSAFKLATASAEWEAEADVDLKPNSSIHE